ncbi:MAG: dephospho-CoA kinase [Aquincola sp.]|nr:dephospho-CoA kinase [Aquincola sp.]MDH5331795.1 dephospho-CoA kinase [Aquincola sp.]
MAATRVARIGLTGGIGSGKSTVASTLVRLGAALVDTDAISRCLTSAGGAAIPALRVEFGDSFIMSDGALDRDAMRQLAFADPEVRRRLEAVLHPMIGEQAQHEAASATAGVVVFDVPLLADSSVWRRRVDRVLVVDCDTGTQIARVCTRPGWTRDLAAQVIAAQLPREARRAVADAVIHNADIGLDTLHREVATLWQLWCSAGH